MDFYGTVAGYRDYHTARGRDVSATTDQSITTGLLIASEWLDGSFRDQWSGYRVGARGIQTRDWPRSWVQDRDGYPVDATTVPIEIEQATYEAAMRQIDDPTALLTDYTPDKYRRVSIDGALSVEYRMMDAATVQKQFPVIGNILSRLLGGAGTSSVLSSRAVRA